MQELTRKYDEWIKANQQLHNKIKNMKMQVLEAEKIRPEKPESRLQKIFWLIYRQKSFAEKNMEYQNFWNNMTFWNIIFWEFSKFILLTYNWIYDQSTTF